MTAEFMSGLIGPVEPNRNQLLIQQRSTVRRKNDARASFRRLAFEAAEQATASNDLPGVSARDRRTSKNKKTFKKSFQQRVAQSLRRRTRKRGPGSQSESSASGELKFPLGGIAGVYDISRLVLGKLKGKTTVPLIISDQH